MAGPCVNSEASREALDPGNQKRLEAHCFAGPLQPRLVV